MDQGVGSPQLSKQDGQQQLQQPQQPVMPPVSPQHIQPASMAMNWSYLKPEVSGKPEGDPEVHIHWLINWMDTHNFAPDQRVQRFPLILAGEARF